LISKHNRDKIIIMLKKILQSYLKFWATRYLARVNPKIIAVTGSVGKTSAKEAIYTVLKYRFSHKVRKSSGNLNTETGVPMAILGYTNSVKKALQWLPIIFTAPARSLTLAPVDYLVLELAADKPGDIKYLTTFIKPNIAVLTAIGPTHLQAFKEMDAIIEEKSALLWALDSSGWAVMNIDNELVRKVSYGGRYHKMGYAIGQKTDLVARDIQTKIENNQPKTRFKITGKVDLSIESQTLGLEANIYAMLAAVGVGKILEVPEAQIKKGLENLQPEKHRMNVLAGKNGSIIIDDCYNANPLSMAAALKVLASLGGRRKIAVLGDMKELGKISSESHRQIGKTAHKLVKHVVAIGPLGRNYHGQKYFKSNAPAIEYLLKEVRSGDILLIKASRSMGFEQIVEALKL